MRLSGGEMLSMWHPARRMSYDKSERRRETRKKMPSRIENLLARANARTAEMNSVTSASRLFQNAAEAETFFVELKNKLFDFERWNAESEIMSFKLHGAKGAAKPNERAALGDFIKTALPAAGKNDWIEIVEIADAPDEIVLTVRPSRDPTGAGSAAVVSHFFAADSTNNFCLQRKNARINFYVIGLREQANTEQTTGVIETVRNLAIANIGTLLGVQKTQWQTFCENFIEKKVVNGKR